MITRYNQLQGYYIPSIFLLQVLNGDGELKDMGKWTTQQKSTFLHEYIHFLQDITTVIGLHNIYTHGEVLRYISELMRNGQNTFTLPLDPAMAGKNVGNNWKAGQETVGDSDTKAISVNGYSVNLGMNLVDDLTGNVTPVSKVEINCIDERGNRVIVRLGSSHMMECMAKAIQESVYPTGMRTSPYNPYYIAEDLANIIIPGLAGKKQTLIALYDRALQSSNPGYSFVRYLEEMAKLGYDSNTLTPAIVYQGMKAAVTNSSSIGITPFSDSFKQLSQLALGVLKEMTGGIWFLSNLDRWAESTLNNGVTMRLKYPELFLELAKGGDIIINDIFQTFLKVFGTPLVLNSKHKCDFLRPANVMISKSEIVDVMSMMQIIYVFTYGAPYPCLMKWYCVKNSSFINRLHVNKRCDDRPWMKTTRFGNCKFCRWWRFKGFKDLHLI